MNTEFKYYNLIIKKYAKAYSRTKPLLKLFQLKILKCHGLSEVKKIAVYHRHDLQSAVGWIHSVRQRFQDWLGLDGYFVQTALFQACHRIADYVLTQWRRWRSARPS